jgi:hypothetical protein
MLMLIYVTAFAGLQLDIQGYKKPETEEIYISLKQTEKKKKSKGQVEDISQKETVKVSS